MHADTKGLQTEQLYNHSWNQIYFSLSHSSPTCARTHKPGAHTHRLAQTHAQDAERVVVLFHSCEHLVQLCNGEFGLMKHMGDGALTQRMVDSACACMCDCVCALRLYLLFFTGVMFKNLDARVSRDTFTNKHHFLFSR